MARGTRPGKVGKLLAWAARTEAATHPHRAKLFVEPLEDRRVLAVTAAIVGGDLVITGDGNANDVDISLNADGEILVVHDDGFDEFDPAAITTGNIIIDLRAGNDDLHLSLIQRDGKSLNFIVDMGNGANDEVFLRENVGSGSFAPALDLSSDTIEFVHVGSGGNSQYETAGVTLNGTLLLGGPVTFSTSGSDFDAADATIAPGTVAGEPVTNASLTIESGKGDVLIGAMNDEDGVPVQSLSITSTGDVTFVAGVGTTEVGSLSVDAGTITINRDINVTDGDTTLESTGVITIGDVTINTGDNDLTLITGVTGADPFDVHADAMFVSGTGATAILRPQDAATPIEIGAPAMPDPAALQLTPADLQLFADFSVVEVGSANQSGLIGVFAALDLDNGLHLHAGMGDIVINAVVDATGTVTVTGDGNTTTINADMMGGALVFNDDVRIGDDGDGITLTAGGGGVTFNSTVDSVQDETNPLTVITMGGGHIVFADTVGANEPLASLTANSAGETRINGSVTTTGVQSYGGNVRVDAPITLTTTDSDVLFSGAVNSQAMEANALTVSTGTGNITFTGAVGAAMNGALGALIATSSGSTRFGSTVQAASLSTSAGGTTQLNDDVTTTGSQTYGDDVRIDSDLELTTTNSPVLFSGMVDSQSGETNNLTVDTGNGSITFTGAVGSAAGGDLGALITDTSGTTRFNSTVLAGSLAANGGGPIQLNGNVTTGGAQNYSGAVRIDADLTLMTTNSQVLFSSTVNSQSGEANDLTVDTGSANITFTGAVGAAAGGVLGALTANSTGTTRFGSSVQAASLTTNADGSTQLNGNVTTTGAQNYGDNVRIDAATVVLTTTNSDVLFSGTVDSQPTETNNLTITAGTGNITFTGAVGSNEELGAVTINSANNVNVTSTFEAGSLVQAAGTGTTTIGGAATLSAAAGLDLSTAIIVINALVDTRTVGGTGVVRLAAGDDVQINAEIRSGSGTVDVLADDDVSFTALGLIDSTSGVVTVQADADGDDNGAGGSVFMTNGSQILAGSGRIVISADEDITLGGLQTTSAAANAVQLTSTSGAIVDGGDMHRDVIAASGTLIIDAVTGIGSADAIETTVAGIDAANTGSGNIQISEMDNVNVVQLSQVGIGNVVLTTVAGSITVTSGGSGISAGNGTVTLTANGATSNITLQQDVTTAAAGNVSLTAGQDILDDGNASTAITTGNLTLSARRNIGDITNFATGAGTPIDIALSGQLLQAEITDAGGEIFLRASGNLTAAANAINPDADGQGTALVIATGDLDVGTFGGVVVNAVDNDNLGLLAGGTLTLPAGGYNVGGGDLRLRGDVNVQDGDQSLGTFTADSLEFVSGAALATTLNTAVNTLTAEMTTSGTALTVLEQDGVLLESVVTNDGDLVVILVSPGDMLVGEVNSGTALTALVATPFFFFGGNGAILDGDAPGPDNVDVTAGEVVLLASQGIGASGNALELDAGILAALTLGGDINLADIGDGLTIGTVEGFVGVQNTSGVLGDDITVAATAPGGNLTVDAAVVTAGSGAVTLSAANDVSFTAIGQITAVLGNVLIDADGGISMTAGAQISTTGGMVELLAGQDIGIAQITTTTGNVDVEAGGGIMMADGSQIVSTSGAIDLLADASITVGQVQTSTIVTMSAGGAIIDGGNTGGADIVAAQTALSAASGIGAGNALETQVSLLSARNTTTGDLVITNSAPGVPLLLTIGDVGSLIGIENTASGGSVDVTNFGSMNVDSTVESAGDLTLTTANVLGLPSHLTVNGQVTASGDIELDAGGNLNLNDTLADNDVAGASVTGRAGGLVVFAPNVIVRSSTGAVADKLPFVMAIDTNIDFLPQVTATVTFGREGEENLTITVDFDGQDVQTESFDIDDPAPNMQVFEAFVVAQLAQITITVTVIDDPNITFFEGGTEVVRPPDVFISGPVFNTGLITSLPRAEPLPLPLLVPEAPAAAAAEVTQILQTNNFDDLTVPPDAPPSGDERIIIVEKIDDNGDVERDRNGEEIQRRIIGEEAEDILADPSKLFQKLKAGRFQIWLKDGAEAERNLIWDVILRDGKPQSGAEGTQRLPTETPQAAQPDVPLPGGGEAAVPTPGIDNASLPQADTAEADAVEADTGEADEASADAEDGRRAVDTESPAPAIAPAAAAGLVLPTALRHLSRYGRQVACAVSAGVSALLRSVSP